MRVDRDRSMGHMDEKAIICGSAPLHPTFTEDKQNPNVAIPCLIFQNPSDAADEMLGNFTPTPTPTPTLLLIVEHTSHAT